MANVSKPAGSGSSRRGNTISRVGSLDGPSLVSPRSAPSIVTLQPSNAVEMAMETTGSVTVGVLHPAGMAHPLASASTDDPIVVRRLIISSLISSH